MSDPRGKRLFLEGVYQRFPSQDRRGLATVLADLHLEIDAGEFVAVVGPSGCGKSTLLNGIGGFVPFFEGTALIEGNPLGPPSRDRGVVFQDYPIAEFLTAVENVALGLQLEGMHLFQHLVPFFRRKRMRERFLPTAMEYLKRVGLSDHAQKFPRQLSGGQRQRVAIAQALATKPKILLMDEPFSGLDPQTREVLQLLIMEIHQELNNTILFVTHDLEEAVFLGTRVVVLSRNGDGADDGARIVHDQNVEKYSGRSVKETAEFGHLIQFIRDKGFKPDELDEVQGIEQGLQQASRAT